METYIGAVYGVRFFHLVRREKFVYSDNGTRPRLVDFSAFEGFFGVDWPEPHLHATCQTTPQTTPQYLFGRTVTYGPAPHERRFSNRRGWIDCRCGVNMLTINSLLFPNLEVQGYLKDCFNSFNSFYTHPMVIALTKGYGAVAVHSDGYRVQEAEVERLFMYSRTYNRICDDIPEKWQSVPITTVGNYSELRKILKKIPTFQKTSNLVPIPESESSCNSASTRASSTSTSVTQLRPPKILRQPKHLKRRLLYPLVRAGLP